MNAAIQRLTDRARARVVTHFLGLPTKDRCSRFGVPLGQAGIATYVDGIDLGRDALFGIDDEQRALVGVAHVALANDVAELGLSVLPAHRGVGLGETLFVRAAMHARGRSISRLFMRCFAGNAPIMRIARRFGMDVVWHDEYADAFLRLAPTSIPAERLAVTSARYDRFVKALVGAR